MAIDLMTKEQADGDQVKRTSAAVAAMRRGEPVEIAEPPVVPAAILWKPCRIPHRIPVAPWEKQYQCTTWQCFMPDAAGTCMSVKFVVSDGRLGYKWELLVRGERLSPAGLVARWHAVREGTCRRREDAMATAEYEYETWCIAGQPGLNAKFVSRPRPEPNTDTSRQGD